jgi:hypothetical protein
MNNEEEENTDEIQEEEEEVSSFQPITFFPSDFREVEQLEEEEQQFNKEQYNSDQKKKKKKRKRKRKSHQQKRRKLLLNEEEECNTFQPRALPIQELPYEETLRLANETWTSKIPETAEEYLLRVRLEAERCEQVVVAKEIDPSHYEHKRTIYKRLKEQTEDMEHIIRLSKSQDAHLLLASKEWGKRTIDRFEYLRKQLQYHQKRKHDPRFVHEYILDREIEDLLPKGKDWLAWHKFCFGIRVNSEEEEEDILEKNDTIDIKISNKTKYLDESSAHKPTLKILLSLDHVTANALLHEMFQWIIREKIFTLLRFQWLYNMMLLIDYPATAKLSADMNEALSCFITYRSTLSKDEEFTYQIVPHINLLANIIIHYFKQGNPDIALFTEDMEPISKRDKNDVRIYTHAQLFNLRHSSSSIPPNVIIHCIELGIYQE